MISKRENIPPQKDRDKTVARLKEANINDRCFLKVNEVKAAFEPQWHEHLYTPEELAQYPRWGICGKKPLVLIDADNQQMAEIIRKIFSSTFESISPRRKLPHFYFKVIGGEVQNKILHLPGRKEGAGEVRAQNQYLVCPGTTIKYKDPTTGAEKIGTYRILNDRPIATIDFKVFMETVNPHLGNDPSQRITHQQMREGVPRGTRHAQGIRYATFLVKVQKFDATTALNEMVRWNQRCTPPMSIKDLGRMVKNAVEYAQKDSPKNETPSHKPSRKEFFGNGFSLEKRGPKVYLFNDEGGALASCNFKSVDGIHFHKKIKEIVGLKDKVIDQISAEFLLKHRNQANEPQSIDKNEGKLTFAEETTSRAWKLIEDPAFLFKLGTVYERGFVVPKINKPRFVLGEERNKRLLPLLVIGAARLDMTSILKVLGPPGTAKDSMMRVTLGLLPIKYVERGYFTAASIRYSSELKAAEILYIPDSSELQGETSHTLRLMRSDDGGIISEYALKDKDTGEMTTKICEVPVKAVVTTSNYITGDTALESGMFTIETNGSPELTLKVKEEKLKLRAGKRPLFPLDEVEDWRCTFNILLTEELPEGLPRIPYAENLLGLLDSSRSESRRDPDKLCDLIALVAWTRRFQKPPEKRDQTDLADLYIALQLGLDVISSTISELDGKEQKIFSTVDKQGSCSCRDVADSTKIPYKTCYRILDKLIEKGYLNKDKVSGKNLYSVLTENAPKAFLIDEGRNGEPSEKDIKHILSSVKGFSLSHRGINDTIIDPVTGNRVKLVLAAEGKLLVETKKNDCVYPHEKVRSVKRTPKSTSYSKKTTKMILPLKMRNENGSISEIEDGKTKKEVNEDPWSPPCWICNITIQQGESFKNYQGNLAHCKCIQNLEETDEQ